jgi:DNA-binding SARP family transcriptional activator
MRDSAESSSLRIYLLGGFQVSMDIRSIPEQVWRRRKAAALVKLLALTPTHRLHREQIHELLWPESDVRAASNNL